MELLFLSALLLAFNHARRAPRAEVMGNRLNFLGFVGDAIGAAAGGIGKLASAAAPVAGLIPGVGSLAGAALGAGGQLLQGNTNFGDIARGALGGATGGMGGGIGGIAQAALPALGGLFGGGQADADSAQSRFLTEQAVQIANENARARQAEFQAGSPLRDAFRTGALSFGDPTNPFNQNPQAPADAGGGGGFQDIIRRAIEAREKEASRRTGARRERDTPSTSRPSSGRISSAALPAGPEGAGAEGELG